MKKALCLFLALVFAFVMPLGAFALDGPNQADLTIDQVSSTEIDGDTAAIVALLFVLSNIEEMRWDMTTNVSSVIPMYDNDEHIVAYCVSLFMESGDAGYVIVSADANAPLVQEFSDSAPALIDMEDAKTETVYYYGPMAYGTEKDETAVYAYENCTASAAGQTGGLIASIKAMGELASTNDDDITDPLTYLRELYPNAAFSVFSSGSVSGDVTGYVMSGTRTCVIYATAAIMQYHSGETFTSVVSNCMRIAQEGGYTLSSTDYYITNAKTKAFMQACTDYYQLGRTASLSVVGVWLGATGEIKNNRPVILGIAASPQYSDHAVTAISYVQYDVDSPAQICSFFGIKDGYTADTRYLDANNVMGMYYAKVA